MTLIKAPTRFRERLVCVGVHTIVLDGGVGDASALNAGELAVLKARGFTVIPPTPNTVEPPEPDPAADTSTDTH